MIIELFKNRVRSKHSKSIIFLVALNGINILLNFILVPLLLDVLDSEKYGIWLTITSLIAWMNFLDFGLGHGLRNKLAESLAIKDYFTAKSIVSTSYFSILFIVILFLVISIFIVPLINWSYVFNSSSELNSELEKTIFIIILFYSFQFLFKLITSIFLAIQKPELASLVNVIGLSLSVFLIWLLKLFNFEIELWKLGGLLVGSPLLMMIIANLVFFRSKYNYLIPNFMDFEKKLVNEIFTLGGTFFLIQLISILLFQTNNFIITHTSGPESVTDFNISFKYLGVVSTIFYLVATPFWSASTQAFATKNYDWVRNKIKQLNNIWIIFALFLLFLILISPVIFKFWLGSKISVDYSLLFLLFLYYLLYMQWTIYGSFINGSGKLKIQLFFTFMLAILHLPLAYYLGLVFGVKGVVISMIIVSFFNIIWPRIQINKLLTDSAIGIWDK